MNFTSTMFVTSMILTAGAAWSQTGQPRLSSEPAEVPLSFELNQGQASPQIKALSRGKGYGVLLTSDESVVLLAGDKKEQTALHFRTLGSNPNPGVSGADPLPGTVSYYLGNDPAKWRTGVATYGKIRYSGVYPGVDLVYYGNQRNLEYDFIVAPGAEPSEIRLGVAGAKDISIDSGGNLILATKHGAVIHHKPVVYQEIDGHRHELAGSFTMRRNREIAFQIAPYDHTRSLVIDPSLGFFTYFGGTGTDEAKAVGVTSPSGLTFFAGLTTSTSLPASSGSTYGGGATDGFISVLNSTGSSVLLTLFLGGSGTDEVTGLTVDPTSPVPTYIAVTGLTNSVNFPVLNAVQTALKGGYDAFVTKFNISISGSTPTATIAFSTYLGGSETDQALSIATSTKTTGSQIVVAGTTTSTDFPVYAAFQPTKAAGYDAFITKFSSAGKIAFSTYLGGAGTDIANAVAFYNQTSPTLAAIAYVTGTTTSTTFPGEATQPLTGSATQSFVVGYSNDGSSKVYTELLGGPSAITTAYAVAVDLSGDAYITGNTDDTAYPLVDPVQSTYGGGYDAFITELGTTGTKLFSTYYGGTGYERPYGIAVDTFNAGNNIFIAGLTTGGFPATAIQTTFGGGSADGFVLMLTGGGTGSTPYSVGYATYLGGTGVDVVYSICVGSQGNARVAGITNSPSLATTGAAQTSVAGGYDGFVARITTN